MANNFKKDILLYTSVFTLIIIIGSIFYINNGKVTQANQNVSASKQRTVSAEKPLNEIADFEKYQFHIAYNINVLDAPIDELNIKIPMPVDEDEKQYISNLKFSMEPNKIYNEGINKIAEFNLKNVQPKNIQITLNGITKVRTYNPKTASLLNKNISPENDLQKYIAPENLVESNDPYIINIANKIKGETQEEILQNIYIYLQKAINYRVIQENKGAKKALQDKLGKCTEYAAAMVALCRAKNIPARIVTGHYIKESDTLHSWVEVYYDKYGWITYDPTYKPTPISYYDNGKLVTTKLFFDTSPSKPRYFAVGRERFSSFNINTKNYSKNPGKLSINISATFKKI